MVWVDGSEEGIPDNTRYRGGGYFQGPDMNTSETNVNMSIMLGGRASNGYTSTVNELGHEPGNGGIGGEGAVVKVSDKAKIYAFNGNLYTDGLIGHEYKDGLNQCPIYAQYGSSFDKYKYIPFDSIQDWIKDITKTSSATSIAQSGYVNKMYSENATFASNKMLNINTKLEITTNTILTNVDMSKQGIGSGAGYTEVSNGTYEVDTSLN